MTRGPFLLGLTGSIGMGKSTTARMFAEEGIPVWDADAAVHRLYAAGGAGVDAVRALAPEAVVSGAVDRDLLRRAVLDAPGLLSRIEAVVHPLVAFDRAAFITDHFDADLVVCDIPLLYESGGGDAFDAVLVVTAAAGTQRERVIARPGMTEEAFSHILARQVPDAEKRARADYIVETDAGLEAARARVRDVITEIRELPDA